MTFLTFREKLEEKSALHLDLKVNKNRRTVLRVLEKRGRWVRLSAHKMFLDAPDEVIEAISAYIRGSYRKNSPHDKVLKRYIHDQSENHDAPDQVDPRGVVLDGRVYNLAELYDEVNNTYFGGKLSLSYTWYGEHGRNNRRQVTFGQYVGRMQLVKMHRILDDPFFPRVFVSFVLYHEMVHSVVLPTIDVYGRTRFHGSEFREKEREFAQYEEARAWEKQNKHHFFRK
ncbi:MAG: hypothetical protein K940chlam9_00553 [Chlamydiae bacterium]|nr:hypothetical protein [Chlamydiota bacterium]